MSTTTLSPTASRSSGPLTTDRTPSSEQQYGDILLELEALAREGSRLDGSDESLLAFSSRILRIGKQTRALVEVQKQTSVAPEMELPRRVPKDACDFYPLARRLYVPIYKRCMMGEDVRCLAEEYGITHSHARRGLARVHYMLSVRAALRSVALGYEISCPQISTTRTDGIQRHRDALEPLITRFEMELEQVAKKTPHDQVVRAIWSFAYSDLDQNLPSGLR